MARFGDVGVALLDPFKATTIAKTGSTTVAARSPYSSGQSFAGLGKQGTIFGKPKPPAIVLPVVQVLPKPPLVVIPATGGGGPSVLPKPPISTLPTTVKPGGTLSIVPAAGGGSSSAAPAGGGASGADSPVTTPPAPGLLSNPLMLGGLAVLAYLILKGGRR